MQSRSRSIKALDYSMSGQAGTESCDTFIEAMGLKYLFSALMGKVRSTLFYSDSRLINTLYFS